MVNSVVYNKHDYVTKLRQRLNQPTCWDEVLNVIYSDNRTIVNAVVSTEPSVVTGTRGTAYNYEDFALTADTLTISTYKNTPIFIDEADRYQQTYFQQMEVAAFQAKKIREHLESAMLAQTTDWTDFGAGDLANTSSNDTTQITVSATNIDDLVRAIRRKINGNNGVDLAVEKGLFIVWRAADFELLEAFAMQNGFNTADLALKNGIPAQKAFLYFGVENYLSTNHTANHLFAGVKKLYDLGILRSTFGRAKFIEDPPRNSAGSVSGLGIVSRVDYGFQVSVPNKTLLCDVNVV